MTSRFKPVLLIMAGSVLLLGGILLGKGLAQQIDAELPVTDITGNQISVYYPSQKRIYVYSQLGENCVYAYTLTTPGGVIERENCK